MGKGQSILAWLVLALPAAAQKPQDRPRVYITDRDSWKEFGWIVASNRHASGAISGRIVREHTESVKTFNRTCPDVTVTENKEKADFALVWDRTNWNETAWTGHQNNLALYKRNGDLVWSGASHRMTTAAKDACKAVLKAAALDR